MYDTIELIRDLLDRCCELVEILLNTLSMFFVTYGIWDSFRKSFFNPKEPDSALAAHLRFRLVFGGWLVLALELQLAADIIGTIISPSYEHLVQLAAIALIRTFLNYFLAKELTEQLRLSSLLPNEKSAEGIKTREND